MLQSGNHTRRAEFCLWEIFQPFAASKLCDVAEDIWERSGKYSGRINPDRRAYCYTTRPNCPSSTSDFDMLERSLRCTMQASPAMHRPWSIPMPAFRGMPLNSKRKKSGKACSITMIVISIRHSLLMQRIARPDRNRCYWSWL